MHMHYVRNSINMITFGCINYGHQVNIIIKMSMEIHNKQMIIESYKT